MSLARCGGSTFFPSRNTSHILYTSVSEGNDQNIMVTVFKPFAILLQSKEKSVLVNLLRVLKSH